MIVVFGSINLDLIFALERLPRPGETILGPGTRLEPGGKGANQAVAAARDGAHVLMAGAVGSDPLAEGALVLLRAAAVDTTRVAVTDRPTGCAAICTDPAGQNLIAVGSGANLLARAEQVEDALLGPATTLVLQMEVPAAETEALISRGRARGARVILNLAPALPLPIAALRQVDVLVVNEHEAAFLATEHGTSAADLHRALGITVVRTLGDRGATYAGSAGGGTVTAHPVTPVDTTAAGDCFTGVLAAALDLGLPLPAGIARANAAAALCCASPGSQQSLPRQPNIDKFLAAGKDRGMSSERVFGNDGYVPKTTTVRSKGELLALLRAWLATSKRSTIGPVNTYGGKAWLELILGGDRRAVLNADTTREAVIQFADYADAYGVDAGWHIIPNRNKEWNKLVFRADREATRGWYCYLKPAATGPGQV